MEGVKIPFFVLVLYGMTRKGHDHVSFGEAIQAVALFFRAGAQTKGFIKVAVDLKNKFDLNKE